MKTLALIIALCSTCIVAAILAPISTSSTTDQRRIADLERRVNQLAIQANCTNGAIPVTSYTRPGGIQYLAATRHVGQKFMWVVVMTPGCLHKHPWKSELGWKW